MYLLIFQYITFFYRKICFTYVKFIFIILSNNVNIILFFIIFVVERFFDVFEVDVPNTTTYVLCSFSLQTIYLKTF